jgi:glycosyltransferase involved in cell wall biosynthesis
MDYLRISDIFVLPSLSEGFPNVILEAMAAGLPIVTTNFEGSSEIVEDGVNGFIVQTKNPKALADSIAEILDDFNVKQSMSARNREAVAKYDWGNIIIHLEKIYDQCLGLNNSD